MSLKNCSALLQSKWNFLKIRALTASCYMYVCMCVCVQGEGSVTLITPEDPTVRI